MAGISASNAAAAAAAAAGTEAAGIDVMMQAQSHSVNIISTQQRTASLTYYRRRAQIKIITDKRSRVSPQ